MGKRKYTFNFVKEYLNNINYTLLSKEYINPNQMLELSCDKNHSCNLRFSQILSGVRCQECNGTKRLTIDFIKLYFKEYNYTVLSNEYINAHQKLEVRCPEEHICNISYAKFQSGRRCKICSRKELSNQQKLKYDDIKHNIEKEGYKLLSENYINAKSTILIQCNKGHIYETTYDSWNSKKQRCTICNISKGEMKIKAYLDDNYIDYKQEYSFFDLLSNLGNPLRFDFAIFNDKNLKYLIEYDGEFHYKKFYKEQNFETLQYHDKLKTEYCNKNNIKLLRIPYWDKENITDILRNNLMGDEFL